MSPSVDWPQMGTDLRPLCHRHNIEMQFCELGMRLGNEFLKPCYKCLEPGCTAFYDIIHGYFDTSEGRGIEKAMAGWKRCPLDGLAMYISEFRSQDELRVWRCSQVGCNGEQSTKGPLAKVNAA